MIDLDSILTWNNVLFSIKTTSIYSGLLLLFYTKKEKNIRLLSTSLIYLLCIYLFDIDYTYAILYILIALCCVITESIYIHFCDETWKYMNPDIIHIPYWLISLWSIAILLIIEGVNLMKTIIN
jgi:hypothetical protein